MSEYISTYNIDFNSLYGILSQHTEELTPYLMFCIIYCHEAEYSSERADSERKITSSLWDDVALLSQQSQEQVLGVLGPPVDPGAPEPVWDMFLSHKSSLNIKTLHFCTKLIQKTLSAGYNAMIRSHIFLVQCRSHFDQ